MSAAAVFGKGNGTGLPPRGPELGRIVTTPRVRREREARQRAIEEYEPEADA